MQSAPNFMQGAMKNALSIQADPAKVAGSAATAFAQSGGLALKLTALIDAEEQLKISNLQEDRAATLKEGMHRETVANNLRLNEDRDAQRTMMGGVYADQNSLGEQKLEVRKEELAHKQKMEKLQGLSTLNKTLTDLETSMTNQTDANGNYVTDTKGLEQIKGLRLNLINTINASNSGTKPESTLSGINLPTPTNTPTQDGLPNSTIAENPNGSLTLTGTNVTDSNTLEEVPFEGPVATPTTDPAASLNSPLEELDPRSTSELRIKNLNDRLAANEQAVLSGRPRNRDNFEKQSDGSLKAKTLKGNAKTDVETVAAIYDVSPDDVNPQLAKENIDLHIETNPTIFKKKGITLDKPTQARVNEKLLSFGENWEKDSAKFAYVTNLVSKGYVSMGYLQDKLDNATSGGNMGVANVAYDRNTLKRLQTSVDAKAAMKAGKTTLTDTEKVDVASEEFIDGADDLGKAYSQEGRVVEGTINIAGEAIGYKDNKMNLSEKVVDNIAGKEKEEFGEQRIINGIQNMDKITGGILVNGFNDKKIAGLMKSLGYKVDPKAKDKLSDYLKFLENRDLVDNNRPEMKLTKYRRDPVDLAFMKKYQKDNPNWREYNTAQHIAKLYKVDDVYEFRKRLRTQNTTTRDTGDAVLAALYTTPKAFRASSAKDLNRFLMMVGEQPVNAIGAVYNKGKDVYDKVMNNEVNNKVTNLVEG